MTSVRGMAACFLFIVLGWCLGKSQINQALPGGSDWKSLSVDDHRLYIAGFVQGYRHGTLHAASLATAKFASGSVTSMTRSQKADYEDSLKLAHMVAPFLLHQSGSGIEGALTKFYGDHKNMPVCWDDALLLSTVSLAGNPATEQQLTAARKHGAKSGCK